LKKSAAGLERPEASDRPARPVAHRVALIVGIGLLWLGSLMSALALLIGLTYFIGNSGEWLQLQGPAAEWMSTALRLVIALIFALSTFWLLFHPRRAFLHLHRFFRPHLTRLFTRPDSAGARLAAEAEHDLEEVEQDLAELEHPPQNPPTTGKISPATPVSPVQPEPVLKPISRRRFVTETALIGAFTLDSFFIEPASPDITRLDIKLPFLPTAFEGLTIAQLSDIHIDPYTSTEKIDQMVAQVNALKPDLTFVTGDFVSRGNYYFDQAAQTLGKLRDGSRLGLYGVTGNHDHWSDGSDLGRLEPLLQKYGLPLLRNTATKIELNGDSLWLLGTDDSSTHNDDWRKTLRAANFQSDEALRRYEGTSILLSHNPAFTRQVAGASPDLLLSGHTHGGQVYIPVIEDLVVSPIFPQYRHYYRVGDRMQVYVNRGAGVVGPPMRFLARPEILLLRLVKA
jgi:predicted MPP superfamily phosphohydrolase